MTNSLPKWKRNIPASLQKALGASTILPQLYEKCEWNIFRSFGESANTQPRKVKTRTSLYIKPYSNFVFMKMRKATTKGEKLFSAVSWKCEREIFQFGEKCGKWKTIAYLQKVKWYRCWPKANISQDSLLLQVFICGSHAQTLPASLSSPTDSTQSVTTILHYPIFHSFLNVRTARVSHHYWTSTLVTFSFYVLLPHWWLRKDTFLVFQKKSSSCSLIYPFSLVELSPISTQRNR
jgi:hypothetical protein